MSYLKIALLFVVLLNWSHGGNIALVQKSAFQYHVIGNVGFGIDEIAVDLDRPTYIIPGRNFIVTTGRSETWLFGTDQIKIATKKISSGLTNWVKIGDRFVAIRLRDGLFLYTINEDGEFVGTKISPKVSSRPSKLILMESMVLHEWNTKGAFLTFLDRNQLKTRALHENRLRSVFYYDDPVGNMETKGDKIEADLSDSKIGSSNLGDVLFPTNPNKKKKRQLKAKTVNLGG